MGLLMPVVDTGECMKQTNADPAPGSERPLGTPAETPDGAFNARGAYRGMYEADQYKDFSATNKQYQ